MPLWDADPLFEIDEHRRLMPRKCTLAAPGEGSAPGALAFRMPRPHRTMPFSDSVRELVKVIDGVEIAREPIVIEDGTTLYGPLPTDVSACWDEIRRVETERNALALSLSHWPMEALERRLAIREERIRALLLTAAEMDYPFAQYELAHRYDEGEGVSSDHEAAYRWRLKAAAGGHPEALYRALSDNSRYSLPKEAWYDLGIVGGKISRETLTAWAEKRFGFSALERRARSLREISVEKGMALLLETAQRGPKRAIDELAYDAYKKKQWQDAVQWSTHLLPSDKDYIRYRYAVACAQLGQDEEAVRVFRDIIQHPEMLNLSDSAIDEADDDIYNYPGRAQGYLYWLTEKGRAHENIHEDDLSDEGFFVYGRLIESENPAKAAACYQRSKYREAGVWLGRLLVFGRGVPQDLERAAQLFPCDCDYWDFEIWPDAECTLLTFLLFLSGYPSNQEERLVLARMTRIVHTICEEYVGPLSPIPAFCEACLHWLWALDRGEEAEKKALEALRAAARGTLKEILARGAVR